MSRDEIVVRVDQGNSTPGFWVAFWLLFILCAIWSYIEWIAVGLGVIALTVFGYWLFRHFQRANAQLNAQIAAVHKRADRQLHGYMSGDPRATYGWEDE